MMTYVPSGQRSQFKLFSSDSKRRRRAASLFHKSSYLKHSWLMLSYPTLSKESNLKIVSNSKPTTSKSSQNNNNNNFSSNLILIRPTTSCSIYSSYRSPAVSVIDSPVIYPKILNSENSSSSNCNSSTLDTSSGNSSPLIQNHLPEIIESCFPICSTSTGTSNFHPSSSSVISSSGSSPTSSLLTSSSIFSSGSNHCNGGKNNTFLPIADYNLIEEIREEEEEGGMKEKKESGTKSSFSNKGIKMMASNHVPVGLSDEQQSGKKNGKLEERLKEVEEERTSVKAMNESASSSLDVTKTTSSSHLVKEVEKRRNRNVRSSSSPSKQGCSSFIERSRELVQSLFHPSSSSSSFLSVQSSSTSKFQQEKIDKVVTGQKEGEGIKERKIVTSKEEDLGHQYNNNYHEHKSDAVFVVEDRNRIEKEFLQNKKEDNEKVKNSSRNQQEEREVKSYRNNHHSHHLANNKKLFHPTSNRKLLVLKKNKNQIFAFSKGNQNLHPPPPLPLPPTLSSSFPIPPYRLLTSIQANNNEIPLEKRRQQEEQPDGQMITGGPKSLPLLHFKDDEPTTKYVPFSHPGQEGGSMVQPVDSSTSCRNCNGKISNRVSKSTKGSVPPLLNVTISQSQSHHSSSSPPGNPSPPESLDSCSLFCSTSNSDSSPSSSPTSSSPLHSGSSGSNSQFQKQGILKTANKSCNNRTTSCCNGCNTNASNCRQVISIHDHLEKLTITGPNDKSGVAMIPPSSNSSSSGFDSSSPLSSSSCSCSPSRCSSSGLKDQVQSQRTGSSSSSSHKKVHFADSLFYEREKSCERREEKEMNGSRRIVGETNPTNRSLSSTDSSTNHSSSLVIISEKMFPSPQKSRCTFKEISV